MMAQLRLNFQGRGEVQTFSWAGVQLMGNSIQLALVSHLRSQAHNSSVVNAEVMNTYMAENINQISETRH